MFLHFPAFYFFLQVSKHLGTWKPFRISTCRNVGSPGCRNEKASDLKLCFFEHNLEDYSDESSFLRFAKHLFRFFGYLRASRNEWKFSLIYTLGEKSIWWPYSMLYIDYPCISMYLSRKFEVPGKIRCETTRKVFPANPADFNNHLAFQALEDGEQRGAIGKRGKTRW